MFRYKVNNLFSQLSYFFSYSNLTSSAHVARLRMHVEMDLIATVVLIVLTDDMTDRSFRTNRVAFPKKPGGLT